MPVEVVAVWMPDKDFCYSFVVVTTGNKVLMEREKEYPDLKEFMEYLIRVFNNNKRFDWEKIFICKKGCFVYMLGRDLKNDKRYRSYN
nr:MAG TPA: hypothetical protein [Caudoviricetes sp.]